MWVAIAFIVLFAIAAWFALTFYSKERPLTTTTTTATTTTATVTSTTTSFVTVTSPVTTTVTSTEALSLLYLENETTLVSDYTVNQPAGSASALTFNIPYAGYIEVMVLSSTTTNTYVEISGTYSPSWAAPNTGWTYSSGRISVGTSGTVFFPVVPGTVTVYIGNTNAFSGATETVTIIYYS
jgi:hypothetical protein